MKPILFSGPMVRAILEGRKTQTRRVCKPACARGIWADAAHPAQDGMPIFWWHITGDAVTDQPWLSKLYPTGNPCPYGQPGDRLWVRETWSLHDVDKPAYKADATAIELQCYRWHPSIHMPRAYSRISLEIVSVRVERVRDISPRDVVAEGLFPPPGEWADDSEYDYMRHAFESLWDQINGPRGFGWSHNPWVWVVEFKRV